jgi:perosamine synthetase
MKYPVYKPFLTGNEKNYVNDCLDSTWISSKGKYLEKFESKFSNYIGVDHCTAVSNGTVALHLALLSLGIGADDEVIVPTLTYIAPVNAITYVGAKPIFVDSNLYDWQISIDDVKRKITSKTRAIIAVHLYGHPCSMKELQNICKNNNIYLIEDCAEAIGSKFEDKYVGSFGDISTFSFFGNKTITTGEGGMVATSDKTLYSRLLQLKGQGLAKYRQYWHDIVGYNFRMTNICAAIGLAQLENVEQIIKMKIQISEWYKDEFKNTTISFHDSSENVFHSYWMCSILFEDPEIRDICMLELAKHEIETRPLFYPVHTMPMYSNKYERHSNAEYLGWRGINLPSYPELSKNDVKFISSKVLEIVKEHARK